MSRLDGLIDSGATRTVLPRWVAGEADLAIAAQLKAHGTIRGGGGVVNAWSLEQDIEAQVVVGREDWGSPFRLRPLFWDVRKIVLGRADFFAAFVVTIEERADPPYFQIANG